MSLVNLRLGFVLAFVGLFLLWLLTLTFSLVNRSSSLVFLVSGFIFLLFFGLSLLYIRKVLRPVRELNDSARLALSSISPADSQKKATNEAEFLSETFQTVLARLQEQQKELNELHLKLSERAASAEVFAQHVVNSLPSGLIAFDSKGFVRVANEPAREIFPFPPGKQINTISFQNLFDEHENLINLISDSLNRGIIHTRIELDYQTHNKKRRLGLTVAPLEVNGEIGGALCLVADITEISELREQIALQRNLESIGVMTAGLAHELKNSLATLHTYAQFLDRTANSEQSKTAATALTGEIRGLSDMVNSFLNFARPQPLSLVEVNLDFLTSDCYRETLAFAGKHKVDVQISGEFPTLKADSTLLRQTILNLLRNGVEAASSADFRKVSVKGFTSTDEAGQRWVNIEVTDTGKGINEKDLPFVFVPFFTTKPHGHGIGLALSHRIVTQHGGILTATNPPEGGAVFTIKLKI